MFCKRREREANWDRKDHLHPHWKHAYGRGNSATVLAPSVLDMPSVPKLGIPLSKLAKPETEGEGGIAHRELSPIGQVGKLTMG